MIMKKTLKDTVNAEWFLIKYLFKTDFRKGILFWFFTSVQYSIPIISVFLWKLILDDLSLIYSAKTLKNTIWMYLGIYILLQVILSVINKVNVVLYEHISRKASCNMDMGIMEKMAQIDISFFDDPQNSDALNAAITSKDYISGNMTWAVDTIIRVISFISGLVIFLSYDWFIGILFIATYIPGAIISYKYKSKVDQWSIDSIPETRKKNYYKSLLTGRNTAKDLRLFNLNEYFKKNYRELWDKIRAGREKLFFHGAVASFFASLLTYSGIILIIFLSVNSVFSGIMKIGTLAMYVGLAKTSGETFGTIIRDLACQIEIDVPHVIHYLHFLKYENKGNKKSIEYVPDSFDIEFRNVFFRYPRSELYALRNVSFKIEPNEKIALVGVNGAGKTTIVKLLLRLYEPESGDILLNGKSIYDYPVTEYHKLFGICFQELNRYSFTLRENIAMSEIDRVRDTNAVNEAAKATGVDTIIDSLSCGLESNMTRQFDDQGIELSDGQWQKIALARAFFRDSRFIILDEPSSALDPQAEDQIFSSLEQLCKDKGAILISHRLSSISMADKIILLDNGSVIESGTHLELINNGNKYAEMYRMQTEKYRNNENE